MFRESRLFTPVISLLMILCAVLTGLTLLFDYAWFLVSASITLAAFALLLLFLRRINKKSAKILGEIGDGIRFTGDKAFMDAPMPVITVYDGTEIIWYNTICAEEFFSGIDMRGEAISHVLPQVDVTVTSPPEGYAITFRDKEYTAYVSVSERGDAEIAVIYLADDSTLKHYAREYRLNRPSVAIITIDNYDEMVQDFKDVERSRLLSQIDNEIEQYFTDNRAFVVRIERDKFMVVIEERGIQKIIGDKFSILDRVRAIHTSNRMSATLSIGLGHEAASLAESEAMARQALDMCLGRGGDQVAVRNQNGYEFYGGISKGVEKRTKVKTRIIANALSELIESSGNVIIMGHRFADLDCLGSSVGMLKAVRAMGKNAVICLDRKKNLVGLLLERLEAGSYTPDDFISPERALELINHHTLLIVLDTHVPHVLESRAVYEACRNVVVIDHHRKLVSYIDNAVIFYHEPYASSASEMVTELIQYFPSQPQITKLEAEALLSGIMLDTKNFIMSTGVRTFEAAAYLRRIGADTVEVRKFIAGSMESYQQKAGLVANAESYRGCAIAFTDNTFEGIKITAPQAADELAALSGVQASFVIFRYDNVINVSARSMGEINVQVVMEKLGGGGHLTMAAAQFPDETTENVRKKVMWAVDEYLASLNPPEEQTG